MKKEKVVASVSIAIALVFASSALRADSYTDFASYMSNSSALYGKGFGGNSGSFFATGRTVDQGGFSSYFTRGSVGGSIVNQVGRHGQGNVVENLDVWISTGHSPGAVTASTHSGTSVFASGSGHTLSAGYADSMTNAFSTTQMHPQEFETPPPVPTMVP